MSSSSDMPSRYDYQFDPNDESTAARICRLVGHDHDVLELGCAAGAMSAVLTGHYGCRVTGVEYDAAAAAQAALHAQSVHVASLEDPDWLGVLAGRRFDTVLAADVLEHLRDPAACLRQLHDVLPEGGRLVVSVPNIAHGGVLASLLCGEFDYCDVGLLDRTHVHFFTPASLGRMLRENGFSVEHETAAEAGAWHPEFARYWQRLPAPLREWLERGPSARAYQAIMVARRTDTPGEPGMRDAESVHGRWLSELPLEDAAIKGELAQLERRLHDLDGRLRRMEASLSWRVTAPLRACARLFRGLRGG